MVEIVDYIILVAVLYAVNLLVYLNFNHGLARNAKGLQSRRYLIASFVSVLPVAVAQVPVTNGALLFNFALSLVCGTAFPVIYHLSNRKSSPDYDNRIDLVYGIYLFGWFSALKIVASWVQNDYLYIVFCALVGIAAFLVALLAVIQWGYYFIFKTNFGTDSMQLVQDTDRNEAIEFVKSFNPFTLILICVAILSSLALCVWGECMGLGVGNIPIWGFLFALAWLVSMLKYIWVGKRSLLCRTGLVLMYLDVKEYSKRILLYSKEKESRLENLELKTFGTDAQRPHTYIMVIGESASRDYMSAYVDMEHDTTPWVRACKEDTARNIIFPNAYACANQTVPTLERVLTERNQYNNKEFYESVSVVDIARKAGYKTYWFSNQGVIGAAETSITLVAKTCDVAKWTKQEVNKVQYDGALLDFLDELNPQENNFVILHLMGSHFNFINRYPAEATQWGEPGVQDNILNYMNSIRYTDTLLKKIYEYGCEKLNLQALIYFSDHACVPDKRRVPHFTGFENVRVPLSLHCSDSYISNHKERFDAMRANKDKYFTNDLMYEFVCGVLDVRSNHFDTDNSLAYPNYKYTRDMLLTNNGQTPINADNR